MQGKVDEGKLTGAEAMFFDLGQNPDACPRISVDKMMAQVTQTCLWISRKGRPAHHFEMLEANGVPVWPEGDTLPAPFSKMFESSSVSSAAWQKLAGNSQHLPTMGNFFAFTLACLERELVVTCAEAAGSKETLAQGAQVAWLQGATSARQNTGLLMNFPLRYSQSSADFGF